MMKKKKVVEEVSFIQKIRGSWPMVQLESLTEA